MEEVQNREVERLVRTVDSEEEEVQWREEDVYLMPVGFALDDKSVLPCVDDVIQVRAHYHRRQSTTKVGQLGALLVKTRLEAYPGYQVEILKERSRHDIVLQREGKEPMRLEVKTSPIHIREGRPDWQFFMAQNYMKATPYLMENSNRINDSRWLKDYKRSCDCLVLVGLDEDHKASFFVVPPEAVDGLQTITIPINRTGSKYDRYRNNWGYIETWGQSVINQ